MNKLTTYIKESYIELAEKTTWTHWSELQQSTGIVLIATVLITSIVWLMDFAGSEILKIIYSILN